MITSLSTTKKINSSQKLKMIEISKSNVLNAINATSIEIIVIIAIQTKRKNIKKKKNKNKNDKKNDDKDALNNYVVVFNVMTHAKLNTIILNIITKFNIDVSFYACFFKIIVDDVIVMTITFFIKKLSKIFSVLFLKQKWLIDSKCSHYIIFNRVEFDNFKHLNNNFSINIIDDIIISIVNIETIDLNVIFFDEIIQIVDLHNVLYVFDLFIKFLFTIQFISHDDIIFFNENQCIVQNKKIEKITLHVTKYRNSYSLNLIKKIEIYTINEIQFETMTINNDVMNL